MKLKSKSNELPDRMKNNRRKDPKVCLARKKSKDEG
jgi:hypothetical protein